MSSTPSANNLLFGVIIPTFNRPDYITEALDSILAQTYENWLAIVVDDASSADYSEVKARYTDPRIRFLRRDINAGCNAARNTGIDYAVENAVDYITLLDDEEIFAPECFEKAEEQIQAHPQYGWFISNNYGERKQNTRDITAEGEMDWVDDYVYGKALRGDKTHMISTKVLGNIRFDGRYRASNMWPFWINLSFRTKIRTYTFPSKRIQYLEDGITKTKNGYTRYLRLIHSSIARHTLVIRHRPTKWPAYKYLTLALLKAPGRAIQYFIDKNAAK